MSRYDLFRKRLAPIAFFLAIGLIARDSCQKDQRTHTTVELAFGAQKPRVRAVDVNVVIKDVTVATFHRVALPGGSIGPCRFQASLPADDGELRIDVDLGDTHQRLTRAFHAIEGASMLVTIPDEPRADEPRADEPRAGEPRADKPHADEPRAGEPRAGEPR
ncbi:MAG TPA: hypothetical protein VH165_20665 [Kofleriaceae bacterium]|nr:hypothetical protein [Kofleriaceae bacterium]